MRRVRIVRTFVFLSLAMFCILGGGILINSVIPIAHAEDNNFGTIDPSQYSVTIRTNATAKLALETVPYTNVIRAVRQGVVVQSNLPSGANHNIQLWLSSDSASDNSLSNGSNTIPASTGTMSNPIPLTGNSWGFAVARNATDVWNNFDTSYSTPDPGKESKWAGVPTKGNEQRLKTFSTGKSGSVIVFYAVSALDNLTEGIYVGNVVYTAIYDATNILEGEMTLTPTSGTAGDEITLNSSAVPTMEDIGNFDVKLVDPDTSEEYACENTVTTKTDQGNLQAKCNVPELPSTKSYKVTATHSKSGFKYTATEQFAYSVPITTFDKAYEKAGKTKATAADGQQYYQMKDMNTSICSAVEPATSASETDTQIGTLVDTRDGKTYKVAKLFDGKCWMIENLRFGSATQSYNLTSEDSNVTNDFTLPAMPTSHSWTGTGEAAELYPSDDMQSDPSKGAVGYYGYYYSWYAATAGTGGKTPAHATADICPKGWSLPADYSVTPERSYSNLFYQYGVTASLTDVYTYAPGGYNKLISTPLQFILSGIHLDGGTSLNGRDAIGFVWTSSSESSGQTYGPVFDPSTIMPQYATAKNMGAAIRCLAL